MSGKDFIKLGKLIHRKRLERGLNRSDFRKAAGISLRYSQMLEHGRGPKGRLLKPSLGLLYLIDEVLDLGDRAYELAGYTRPLASPLNPYMRKMRLVFDSASDKDRKKMLAEFSDLIKRYNG